VGVHFIAPIRTRIAFSIDPPKAPDRTIHEPTGRSSLEELRKLEGNPEMGPILRGVSGKPLNLDMLARDVIKPALRNPENYPTADAKRLQWHGYYAFRRGIATLTDLAPLI